MYAVSADSRGLDTVVGLLADVVLQPCLTGMDGTRRGPVVGGRRGASGPKGEGGAGALACSDKQCPPG